MVWYIVRNLEKNAFYSLKHCFSMRMTQYQHCKSKLLFQKEEYTSIPDNKRLVDDDAPCLA